MLQYVPVETEVQVEELGRRGIQGDGAARVAAAQVVGPGRPSRASLPLADQDILNLVGGRAPWLLQPLPCEWNYHTWQCRPDHTERSPISRMRPGVNLCPGARSGGVALLHGNCQVGPAGHL